MNPGAIPPPVRTAAQQWWLRLQSAPADGAECEAFERWRAADPAHAAAYRAVESVWRQAAAVAHDPALEDVLHQARRLPPQASLHRWTWPALAAAACLMLAVGVGCRMWWMPGAPPPVTYATATGEQRTLRLEDGSTVVLDTRSRLQVQYGRRERRLTLLAGQADFQVRKDPTRPFVVHAGGGTVTATGTQFQVRLAGGTGTVTLLEGQVVVAAAPEAKHGQAAAADGSRRVTLRPGERIAIRPDGRLEVRERLAEPDLAQAREWTAGTLVVREWPLARLLGEMNRYTDTPFRLGDPRLGELHVSGSFKPHDRQSLLLSLEYGWPIRADRSDPDEIVLYRK